MVAALVAVEVDDPEAALPDLEAAALLSDTEMLELADDTAEARALDPEASADETSAEIEEETDETNVPTLLLVTITKDIRWSNSICWFSPGFAAAAASTGPSRSGSWARNERNEGCFSGCAGRCASGCWNHNGSIYSCFHGAGKSDNRASGGISGESNDASNELSICNNCVCSDYKEDFCREMHCDKGLREQLWMGRAGGINGRDIDSACLNESHISSNPIPHELAQAAPIASANPVSRQWNTITRSSRQ